MTFGRQLKAVLIKDLRIEVRNPGILYTMLLFAALQVVIFGFAFYVMNDESNAEAYVPGLMWIVILFSSTLGTGRIFDREQQNDCLAGLMMGCAELRVVYLSKVILALGFSLAMVTLVIPLVIVFFDPEIPHMGLLILTVFLGVLGFCFVGTLFAGLVTRLAFREVLYPLIVFPLIVPLFLAGVEATSLIFLSADTRYADNALADIWTWLRLMLAFDLVFVFGTSWIFPYLMRDRG